MGSFGLPNSCIVGFQPNDSFGLREYGTDAGYYQTGQKSEYSHMRRHCNSG
jgi:hypothetical protein